MKLIRGRKTPLKNAIVISDDMGVMDTVNARSMHQVAVKERKTQKITKIEFEKLKITQMKGE